MAIEFRCTACEKLLRVDSKAAGQQARCPACGEVSTVPAPQKPEEPAPGSSPFSPARAPDRSPRAEREPTVAPPVSESPFPTADGRRSEDEDLAAAYRPPSADTMRATDEAFGSPFALRPTRLDFSDVFSRTWRVFEQNAGMSIAAGAIVFGFNIAGQILMRVPQALIEFRAVDPIVGVVGMAGIALAIQAVLFWLGIGQARYFLKVARGERPPLSVLFTGGPYFFPVLGASILFGLMTVSGFLVAALAGVGLGLAKFPEEVFIGVPVIIALIWIIPYIVLTLTFSQFYYLIVDNRTGVIQSFRVSREVMSGNRLTLLGLTIVGGMLGGLATVVTCYLGLIVVLPLVGIGWAVIYLTVTGQPTGELVGPMSYPSPSYPSPFAPGAPPAPPAADATP